MVRFNLFVIINNPVLKWIHFLLSIYSILFSYFCHYTELRLEFGKSIISVSVSVAPRSHLLLSGSAAALDELAVVVHGGGSAARGLTALSSFRVQHPPWAFPRALVLHAHEPAVQRQIVTNRVLQKTEQSRVRFRQKNRVNRKLNKG